MTKDQEARIAEILQQCEDYFDARADAWTEDGIIIPTLEGDHLARVGDYIIRGVAGEFYPCKPDIFEKTYEAVLGDAP